MENKFLKGEAMETKPTSLKRENHFKGETHYCPVKILDLEINRVDHHPLGR